jgi:hypothetical protein
MEGMKKDRSPEQLAKRARAVLADLASQDLTALTSGEVEDHTVLTAEVLRLAEGAHVGALDRLDVTGAHSASGARTAAHFAAWKGHLSLPRARSLVRCARRLRAMPATEAAFRAGQLTPDHVRLLAHARSKAPDDFADDEAHLADLASTLLFSSFERIIAYWVQRHDPDGAERDAEALFDQRRVDCSETFEGVVVLDALLDPVTGGIVARELARLERELFEADWAEARERLGTQPGVTDLRRTPKQRRADALRTMAERSAAKPADATEARVLLQVLVGHESVERLCELSNGRVVAPGQLLPILAKADVERIVFDGPSKVIDVGVRRRFFRGATRTAVLVRDRGCAHPSCEKPLDECEVDHVVPHSRGGATVQDNGEGKCDFHNVHKADRMPPPAA